MKVYVIITGIVFALLFASHILRAAIEGPHVLTEPIFIFTTVVSLAFTTWAAVITFRLPKL